MVVFVREQIYCRSNRVRNVSLQKKEERKTLELFYKKKI